VTTYTITTADRRPLPASYRTQSRHLGWRGEELDRPFAHYYAERVSPIQPHVAEVLGAPGQPSELGYEVTRTADRLSKPGYEAIETGWTRTDNGTFMVACHTLMPGVTAEMWDWWMGWHGTDTARYKLWHPDAHAYSSVGEDRSRDRELTGRQRYLDNVSYVDEYIGTDLQRLSIRFFDPQRLGFPNLPGTTYICARVGLSAVPVAAGWLVHQVRPVDDGAEMRSRFFLGNPEILTVPSRSTAKPSVAAVIASPVGRRALRPALPWLASALANPTMAANLMHHCAQEMNHLAGFLPRIHDEFHDVP
jgi:hypothetical protein